MCMHHKGRAPGSTDCDCGARERLGAYLDAHTDTANVTLGGLMRAHTDTCAVRVNPHGAPFTDAELDAARAVELFIMAHDGGEVDVRHLVRAITSRGVLVDPADVLMDAADRLYAYNGCPHDEDMLAYMECPYNRFAFALVQQVLSVGVDPDRVERMRKS